MALGKNTVKYLKGQSWETWQEIDKRSGLCLIWSPYKDDLFSLIRLSDTLKVEVKATPIVTDCHYIFSLQVKDCHVMLIKTKEEVQEMTKGTTCLLADDTQVYNLGNSELTPL
jgi:hypothetical protein